MSPLGIAGSTTVRLNVRRERGLEERSLGQGHNPRGHIYCLLSTCAGCSPSVGRKSGLSRPPASNGYLSVFAKAQGKSKDSSDRQNKGCNRVPLAAERAVSDLIARGEVRVKYFDPTLPSSKRQIRSRAKSAWYLWYVGTIR